MSSKTGIIVQARMSSTRLPGKSLMKIGPNPVIWYVVKRLEQVGLPVIVATSTDPSDDILAGYLKEQNILYYRGSLENVLNRYILTAEEFEIENIVRVTGDNPLVDIDYLEENLGLFQDYTYVDGIYEGGLIKGCGFELVTFKELKEVSSRAPKHLEHVTSWLREHVEESSSRTQLKANLVNKIKPNIILTCDYPEDLKLLREIFRNFDYRPDIPVAEVVEFLNNYPYLKEWNSYKHNNT